MSSGASRTTDGTDQQTLSDLATAALVRSFPDDIILRYESNEALEEFIERASRLITYVMFNFTDAERLLRQDGTLYNVLDPSQVPIISAADEDEVIYNRQYSDIWSVLEACQPVIYIPDAGKVYTEKHDPEKQLAGIDEYKRRLDRVMEEIDTRGWDIHVLPLAKGIHRWHFEELKPCYEKHGFENYASYTRQFVGGGRGNQVRLLEEHLQNLIDVMDAQNVFLIARHGPTHLERFPPQVTGASGITNFAKHCKLEDGSFSIERFQEWRDDRRKRLTEHTLEDY